MDHITAADAARKIGCAKSTVTRAVQRLGLGRRIGPVILLTPAEVKKIAATVREKSGNPNFVAGNTFGTKSEKTSTKSKKD